ncbi:hypothetical protein M9434_002787 [Picochlorum sp. BPE23]|nr:hypothetical protein M9434_002787 [Picochlorum sp. BPE23]
MCTTQHNTDRHPQSGRNKGNSNFHGGPETPSPLGMHSVPIARTPVLEGEVCVSDKREREQEVLDAANRLCDFNVQLMAHIETLRSRILELEEENSSLRQKVDGQPTPSQGDESVIHLLQVEVADLERQLYHAKIARKSAEENEAAARERADMISAMFEQFVTKN